MISYTRTYQGETILVVGNLDSKHSQKRVKLKVSGIKKDEVLEIIQGQGYCKTRKNKIYIDLEAGQIRVFKI